MFPLSSTPRQDLAAFGCAAALLVVALVFGGGPRGAGDALVHAAMLPALGFALWRWRWAGASRWDRVFAAWCACALALVLAQLMPLPGAWFAALPERAGVVADLDAAGVALGTRPMTLDAWATVRAGLALATFVAAWALGSTLSVRMQRRLLVVAVVAGVGLAFFGFLQAAAGPHAPRFHGFHHEKGALGLFANRNHFADLLAMLLPIALAFAVQAQRERRGPWTLAAFAAAIALWLGAALTFSRAGFVLASWSLVASVVVLWWPRGEGGKRWLLPVFALGIAVLAVGHYAWDGLVQRLEQDPLDDLRWQYVRHGVEAMWLYWPWGSGLGTFPWVYAPLEPLAETIHVYAERAHNDPLQVAIEAGLPGVVLVAWFAIMVVVKAMRNFPIQMQRANRDDPVRSVLWIALSVPLLHAWVDYPMRTLAVSVLAGVLLACRGRARQAGF